MRSHGIDEPQTSTFEITITEPNELSIILIIIKNKSSGCERYFTILSSHSHKVQQALSIKKLKDPSHFNSGFITN